MWGGGASYSDVSLSKELVRVTRHGKHGLKMDEHGFVAVDDILEALSGLYRDLSFSDIERIVNDNSKKRFELKQINGKWYLKATQGHTVQVTNFDAALITDPYKYSTVVHGTRMAYWSSIKDTGLCRMKRTHIHFAIGLPGDANVVSGMPPGCDVAIYIDLPRAIGDGLKFYESSNKVILCEGDIHGRIQPKYFKKVVRMYPIYQELSFSRM